LICNYYCGNKYHILQNKLDNDSLHLNNIHLCNSYKSHRYNMKNNFKLHKECKYCFLYPIEIRIYNMCKSLHLLYNFRNYQYMIYINLLHLNNILSCIQHILSYLYISNILVNNFGIYYCQNQTKSYFHTIDRFHYFHTLNSFPYIQNISYLHVNNSHIYIQSMFHFNKLHNTLDLVHYQQRYFINTHLL